MCNRDYPYFNYSKSIFDKYKLKVFGLIDPYFWDDSTFYEQLAAFVAKHKIFWNLEQLQLQHEVVNSESIMNILKPEINSTWKIKEMTEFEMLDFDLATYQSPEVSESDEDY